MLQINHKMNVRAGAKTASTVRYAVATFFCLATMLLPVAAQSQCPSFVCSGQAIPSGCIITQIQTISSCGSGANNAQFLKFIQGEPFSMQETACVASPIPSDWAIIDTPSIPACGDNNPGNARTLLNLNGAPLNQLETVCNITNTSNLPGWQIIQAGIDVVPRCGSAEPSHVGEQIQNTVAPPPPPPTGDFSLSVVPGSAVAVQGTAVSVSISITRTQGFSGNVALSISGLPPAASAGASPGSTTGNSSTVTVTTGTVSPIGTFSISITGSSGSLVHTTDLTLGVSPSWWPAIEQILE